MTIINKSHLLTCAHNVMDYNKVSQTRRGLCSLQFGLRENKALRLGSSLIQQYNTIRTKEHYDNSMPKSGYDTALCWNDIPENNRTMKEKLIKLLQLERNISPTNMK